MFRRAVRLAVITAGIAGLLATTPTAASAHERREVGGRWTFVVGWGDEPAYSGFKNSVQARVSSLDGEAVTDLGDALKVDVVFGGETATLAMEPNFRVGAFGTPGDYRAWITPTRPGRYTFRFTGTIGEQNIDESFTSGPQTFDDVTDVTEIQFPAKDPSTAQLAERLNREIPRMEDRIAAVDGRAGTSRTLGYVGIGLGVLAVGIALFAARRPSKPVA